MVKPPLNRLAELLRPSVTEHALLDGTILPRTLSAASALPGGVSAKNGKATKLASLQNNYQPHEAFVAQWSAMQGWCLGQLYPVTCHLSTAEVHNLLPVQTPGYMNYIYTPSHHPKHRYLKCTLFLPLYKEIQTISTELPGFHCYLFLLKLL